MEFVGTNDSSLKAIEETFNVSITISSNAFNCEGSIQDAERSISFIDEMIEIIDVLSDLTQYYVDMNIITPGNINASTTNTPTTSGY